MPPAGCESTGTGGQCGACCATAWVRAPRTCAMNRMDGVAAESAQNVAERPGCVPILVGSHALAIGRSVGIQLPKALPHVMRARARHWPLIDVAATDDGRPQTSGFACGRMQVQPTAPMHCVSHSRRTVGAADQPAACLPRLRLLLVRCRCSTAECALDYYLYLTSQWNSCPQLPE